MKKYVLLILLIVFLGSSCNKIQNSVPNSIESAGNGTMERIFNNFTLKKLDGSNISLDEVDKPVFVNYFATWCGPCMGEMPDLMELYKEYGNDIEFLFVDTEDDIDAIKAMIKEKQYNSALFAIDVDGELAKHENIMAIPTTFILDKNKVLIKNFVGAYKKDIYEEYIKQAINSK